MRKKIYRISTLVLLSVIFVSMPVYSGATSDIQVSNFVKSEVDTKVEQVEWKYRYYNGKLQRRLWSYTYGYWKTSWMYV